MNKDFEGIYKFKFFIPFVYLVNWALVIFGSIFFSSEYQIYCIVILIYSHLKTIGLGIGAAYALYKLNKIIKESQIGSENSKQLPELDPIYHAIVIPNYKEDEELLQETLNVLAAHDHAKRDYLVLLAMEAHEPNADKKAQGMIEKNKEKFKYMGYTTHKVKEGEAKGKASNVSWCVERLMQNISGMLIEEQQVMVTVLDADSWAPNEYFRELNKKMRNNPQDRYRSFFTAPQIYTRNNFDVPVVNRVYDIMHSFAHLASMVAIQFSLPLSNYSLSYTLIKEIGFWDTCADAIGEDFHTCQKCYWKKQGDVKTVPIYVPFNQLSLTTGEGYCEDMKARFWQAERHTRGVSDVAYCLNMLFKGPFVFKNIFLTLIVAEVFIIAAVIPWAMLMLGLHYKVISEESGLHHHSMLMIDILLNLTPAFTIISFIFYEIFKRRANTYIWKQENESLWRVLEYPIIFVVALFGYSVPAFIIASFGVLCTNTEYRVAEKVVAKVEHQEMNPEQNDDKENAEENQQNKQNLPRNNVPSPQQQINMNAESATRLSKI